MTEQPSNYNLIKEVNPRSSKQLAHIGYILQVIGLIPLFGMLPFIAGVILAYIKLPEVQDIWLASHFRWQIRTFWFGCLWWIVGAASTWILGLGVIILFVNYIWIIFRIVKGWIYLNDSRELQF
jgi:uncharacterized membrane protein